MTPTKLRGDGIVTFVSVQWVRERYQIRRSILIDSLSWDEVAQNGRVAPHKLKALLTIGHLPMQIQSRTDAIT